jgi:hypothetical protein
MGKGNSGRKRLWVPVKAIWFFVRSNSRSRAAHNTEDSREGLSSFFLLRTLNHVRRVYLDADWEYAPQKHKATVRRELCESFVRNE